MCNYSVSILREHLYVLQSEREGFLRKVEFEEKLVNTNDKLIFRNRKSMMLGNYDTQINDLKKAIDVLVSEKA